MLQMLVRNKHPSFFAAAAVTKIKKLYHFAIRTPFRNRTETSRRPSPLSRFSSNAYCEVYPKEGGDDEAQGKSVRKGADEKDPVIAPSPGKLFFALAGEWTWALRCSTLVSLTYKH